MDNDKNNKEVTLQFRALSDDRDAFRASAKEVGLSFSAWARLRLKEAVREQQGFVKVEIKHEDED